MLISKILLSKLLVKRLEYYYVVRWFSSLTLNLERSGHWTIWAIAPPLESHGTPLPNYKKFLCLNDLNISFLCQFGICAPAEVTTAWRPVYSPAITDIGWRGIGNPQRQPYYTLLFLARLHELMIMSRLYTHT